MLVVLGLATACPPGSYMGSAGCVPCGMGTYTAVSSSSTTACLQCAAGKYSDAQQGATICTACPAGKTTLDSQRANWIAGATACSTCIAGHYLAVATCAPCTLGYSFCDGLAMHLCSQAHAGQFVGQACSLTSDTVILNCSRCRDGEYALQPCSSTTDTQCSPCTVCSKMLQFQVAKCNATRDTVCAPCDKQAGDMQVGGRCNLCPAGSYNNSAQCALCPPNTYSPVPNALACLPCSPGTTSGVGASRCVVACAAGTSFAPDGLTCVPLASAQALPAAWDASLVSQIQAAAPTSVPGKFLVATTTFGSSQLYVMGAGDSWLLAGAPGTLPPGQDGQGELASFTRITCMAYDEVQGGYMVADGASLRWVTENEGIVTTLPAAVGGPWAAMSSFRGADGTLTYVLASAATGAIWTRKKDGMATRWLQGQTVMPLSVHFFFEGPLHVLDQGLIMTFASPSASPVMICGGGSTVLQGVVGMVIECNAVDLVASGALDLGWDDYANTYYVLLFNAAWSGVGSISQDKVLTVTWVLDSGVPLSFVGSYLFVGVRIQAQILRMGMHGCLCDAGFYCQQPQQQCLEAPIGTEAPMPWTSTPTPCPRGSFRQADQDGCTLCPRGYTAPSEGAWMCLPDCGVNQFWMASTGVCVPGCNQSLGLYHDTESGQCAPCWLGSGSTGGMGVSSCYPCVPGQYGVAPGLCAPCPDGYTTETTGATKCMPVGPDLASDGGLPALPQSGASLFVFPNGTILLDDAPNVLMQYCVSCGAMFRAVRGESCIRKGEPWVGQCGTPGPPAQGLLPAVYGLSLMEAPQRVPVLYVSSMVALEGEGACAEVYAVSTYDRSITYFISQDILKQATVQIQTCILQPIVLASTGDGTVYAAVGSMLYYASQTFSGLMTPQSYLQQVPMGTINFITAFATGHYFLGTSSGQIQSVPSTASTTFGAQTQVVQTTGLIAMGAAGRRVIYLDAGGHLKEVLFSNVQGCMAGFVATKLESVAAGVCMQAGRGSFTDLYGQLQRCPPGTYGDRAGTTLCLPCPPGTFSVGMGSAICTPCQPGEVSSEDGTACLSDCPPGSWRSGQACSSCGPGLGYKDGGCVPCSAGTFSSEGMSSCTACDSGKTSPQGAHSCVQICDVQDHCAYDGEACMSLTKDYQVLSQILMNNTGGQILGLTVDSGGGVFFTDGTTIQYYQDDCASYDTQCTKTGAQLLPPNQYTNYMFSSLAICDRIHPSADCSAGQSRSLYAASLVFSSIYVLEVCQNDAGEVDTKATGGILRKVVGGSWGGFADGAFSRALFNQPVDLELNAQCSLLYVSDFANHRIRLVNFTSGVVSTLVGTGHGCWKAGYAACSDNTHGCDVTVSDCASLYYPMGIALSEDEADLYIAANTADALYVLRGGGYLTYFCGYSYNNAHYGTTEECNFNADGSKGCMLHRPFDAAVFNMEIYVGVTQGITKLFGGGGCQQVAGQYFDLQTSGLRDGIKPQGGGYPSLVNMPFKLAIARSKGVLYFADLMNGAVRRVLVKNYCICPVGFQLLPDAASCYNPSPDWAKSPLPLCKAPGFYALPGDTTCFRSCADAQVSAAPCLLQPNQAQFGSLTYAQLLGNLNPPQNSLHADWYGLSSAGAWDAIFASPSSYKQGRITGMAPSGSGDGFVSLTMQGGCWAVETQYALQPRLILPGLWVPCATILATEAGSCACPTNVFAFEATPTTPAQENASFFAPKRWQALRNAATAGGARFTDLLCPLLGQVAGGCGVPLTQSSVFMMLGTDQRAPQTCPDEGPCFLQWQLSSSPAGPAILFRNTQAMANSWKADGIQTIQCMLGWPAHYYCPNGYVWIPPRSALAESCSSSASSTLATCLSCLPGTYSFLETELRHTLGGPYQCLTCEQGSYASAVGATECLLCPANTYSSEQGSSACTRCEQGNYTVIPGAYSELQCVPCPPGTGNCTVCIPGQYQPLSGQFRCEIVPAGHYSPLPNASLPTMCPPSQYQDLQGRTACKHCPLHSTSAAGATACTACPTSTTCSLSLENTCGKGCGLNQYYDLTRSACIRCANGTLNAMDPCAADPNVCWESPQKEFYLAGDSILPCPPGTQANSLFNGCEGCKPGLYSAAGTGGCLPCPAGQTSTGTACQACDAGTTSLAGDTRCLPCQPGTFAPVRGSPLCLPCNAGKIAPWGASTACSPCERNWVASQGGMTACDVKCNTSNGFYAAGGESQCRYCSGGLVLGSECQGCGLGHYLAALESRVCVQCPSGLVNLQYPYAPNGSVCIPCPSPTAFASSDGMACLEANPGYIPAPNHSASLPCPPGTFRNATQTACTQCAPGYFASGPASVACTACPLGTYTADEGQVGCRNCISGEVSSMVGSTTCVQCASGTQPVQGRQCTPCPNNTYSQRGMLCRPCVSGQYAPMMGASACSTCPDWTSYDPKQGRCAVCSPGRYMASAPIFYCQVCPVGTFQPLSGSVSSLDCIPCSSGLVALSPGSSGCGVCPPGTMATTESTCDACPPGSYSTGGGGSCVQCPAGTYAASSSAVRCATCPPGSYQPASGSSGCLLCPPGSISDGSSGLSCLSCYNWPGTFAASYGQTLCLKRQTVCPHFWYVNMSLDPALDNTCTECPGCSVDELAVAYQSPTQTLGLLSPSDIASHLYDLCPGNTEAPLYRCLPYAPVAGRYLSLTQAVGAAVGSPGIDPYTFQTCTDPLYDSAVVRWVGGPDMQTCYVGCLYGVSVQGALDYQRAFQSMPRMYAEDTTKNQFLQRMLQYKQSVCLPCPRTECPLGRYRPDYGKGCGPPCAVETCDNAIGCTGICTNRPPSSGYVGGGPHLGQNWCPWACLLGWHLSDDRSTCLPCQYSPLTLCNSSDFAVISSAECMPWHTSLDICKYCPPLPYARLLGWNQTCQYQCYSGYFWAQGCLPCGSVFANGTRCPVGMFLDESICYAQGLRPACTPCMPPPPSAVAISDGGRNRTHCRALCTQGFHTVSASTGAYGGTPFVDDVVCVTCMPDDGRSCFNTSTCFVGSFRNLSVADSQPHSCVPCTQSAQCNAGFYAPLCDGKSFVDAPCLPCDPQVLKNQQFVPYPHATANRERVIFSQGTDCPRACLNNYIQKQDSPSECISCRSLAVQGLECAQQGIQPPLCAFVYSYWNADPGQAWWDQDHAPPFLPYAFPAVVDRAGVCWACPIGSATLADSQDLCVTLPGYTTAIATLPTAKIPIPSLPSDIYFTMQAPRMPAAVVKTHRRLLQVSGKPSLDSSSLAVVGAAAPCPFGSYKSDVGAGQCFLCPQGTSTIQEASMALSACMCQYGYYLQSRQGPCIPCPEDTFSLQIVPVTSQPQASCTPCPANHSTLGATGATRCACALGFWPKDGGCALCPAGFYCPPCTTADLTCPPLQIPCFPDSSSPAGSYGLSNCTCMPGLVLASRPYNTSQLYCRTLPLGARLNPQTGLVECLPGWKTISNEVCQLCPEGAYFLEGKCLLCPADTYNPTLSAMGGCTPCPLQQSTMGRVGATRLENCSCPFPMIQQERGGCLGCRQNQYLTASRSLLLAIFFKKN